jgi:hypothetical protein
MSSPPTPSFRAQRGICFAFTGSLLNTNFNVA